MVRLAARIVWNAFRLVGRRAVRSVLGIKVAIFARADFHLLPLAGLPAHPSTHEAASRTVRGLSALPAAASRIQSVSAGARDFAVMSFKTRAGLTVTMPFVSAKFLDVVCAHCANRPELSTGWHCPSKKTCYSY